MTRESLPSIKIYISNSLKISYIDNETCFHWIHSVFFFSTLFFSLLLSPFFLSKHTQPLTRGHRAGQQANEVISIAQTLNKKFQCLLTNNLMELKQIMAMEGQGGGVGGIGGGVNGVIDPDGRQAARLRQQIQSNNNHQTGTGHPIRVHGCVKNLGRNDVTESRYIGTRRCCCCCCCCCCFGCCCCGCCCCGCGCGSDPEHLCASVC